MSADLPRRVFRFEVPDSETLERLVDIPLPGDGAAPELRVFRDTFFDTRSADLRERNATVRLRQDMAGTASLVIDVIESGMSEGLPRRRRAQSPVSDCDPAAMFAEETEAAALVRALVNPGHLVVVTEIETQRRTRHAAFGDEGDAVIHYDALTIRAGDLSADLYEMEAVARGTVTPGLDSLLGEMRRRTGVRPVLAETAGRVHELVENLRLGRLSTSLRAAREVAVIVHSAGTIAFIETAGGLALPAGTGTGADACRSALRASIGHANARIRLLGNASGMGDLPALQVWLAEDADPAAGRKVVRLRIDDALERAGAPGRHDARTLRALHVVARSGFRTTSAGARRGRSDAAGEGGGPLEHVLQRLEGAADSLAIADGEVPPELLLNMELSRMAFDERILVMAEDPRTPLLARVRFLSMYGQRRDDFFMTRVSRFKRMVAAGDAEPSMDGLTPAEQLDVIGIRARQMIRRAYTLLRENLLPDLQRHGIRLESWDGLDEDGRRYLRATYGERLEALVMPVAADPMHPFPHVRNLRPALAATVRLPGDKHEQFIAVELPSNLPRFPSVPGGKCFVMLEDVIKAMLPELYPGLEVVRAHTFRVTRSAAVVIDEDPHDILEVVAAEVARRPFQEVVRLEVERSMPPEMRLHLLRELQYENEDAVSSLDEQDVYTTDQLVDLAALAELARLDVPELHFPVRTPVAPFPEHGSMFQLIAERDRFVKFPEDSFSESVERLLKEAAEDPDVVAIKTTLYRTSEHSPIVAALQRARERGKDALAIVELKASFDEQRNIEWARELERAGIRVVFSPPKYKVHAKVALIVRREGENLRRYAYFGTGNLNSSTAASYIDVGIFTVNPVLTQELNGIFNLLSGYSGGSDISELLVSPFNMRERFLTMIRREADHARAGRPAQIRAQLNGLADRRLIAALYEASQAGVKIDMMVREICALRPGVPGVSDNIRISSVLGRYLQHARIFHFHNNGEDEYFIGSADWRPRNMSERVEVIAPVWDPEYRARLDRILADTLYHPDTWVLQSDGTYARGEELIVAAPRDAGAVEPG